MNPRSLFHLLGALRHPSDEDLQDVADHDAIGGGPVSGHHARVMAHVAHCARCRTRLHHARSIREMLAEVETPPADLLQRIMAARSAAPPMVPMAPQARRPRLPSGAALLYAAASAGVLLAGAALVNRGSSARLSETTMAVMTQPGPGSSSAPAAADAADTVLSARTMPAVTTATATGAVTARERLAVAENLSGKAGGVVMAPPPPPPPVLEPPSPAAPAEWEARAPEVEPAPAAPAAPAAAPQVAGARARPSAAATVLMLEAVTVTGAARAAEPCGGGAVARRAAERAANSARPGAAADTAVHTPDCVEEEQAREGAEEPAPPSPPTERRTKREPPR